MDEPQDSNLLKYGCMKRIVFRKPEKEWFPLTDIPSIMVTTIIHKLKTVDRMNIRLTCKGVNDFMDEIGKNLSSRPDSDLSLRFETDKDNFNIHVAEPRVVYNFFNQFERKIFYSRIQDMSQVESFSFDSMYFTRDMMGTDESLRKMLELLKNYKFGVNFLWFKNLSEEFVQNVLKVVKCGEVKFEDNNFSLTILKNPCLKDIQKISFHSICTCLNSIYHLLESFSDIFLRFTDHQVGHKINKEIASALGLNSILSIESIQIEVHEDNFLQSTDPLKGLPNIQIFDDDFLENKYFSYGDRDNLQGKKSLPTRINLLDSNSKKMVLLVQNEVILSKATYKTYEYRVLSQNEKTELRDVVLHSIAGKNWPLDFSLVGELLQETEYDQWLDILRNFCVNLKL